MLFPNIRRRPRAVITPATVAEIVAELRSVPLSEREVEIRPLPAGAYDIDGTVEPADLPPIGTRPALAVTISVLAERIAGSSDPREIALLTDTLNRINAIIDRDNGGLCRFIDDLLAGNFSIG